MVNSARFVDTLPTRNEDKEKIISSPRFTEDFRIDWIHGRD